MKECSDTVVSTNKNKAKENNLQWISNFTKSTEAKTKQNKINLPKLINEGTTDQSLNDILIILYAYLPIHIYYIHAFPRSKTKLQRFSMGDAFWFSYFSAFILVDIDTISLSNLNLSIWSAKFFQYTLKRRSLGHTSFSLVINYKLGNSIIKWFRKTTSKWERLGFNHQLHNLGQITFLSLACENRNNGAVLIDTVWELDKIMYFKYWV